MLCHGDPRGEFDPDKDGKDALGFAMEGWKVGGTHGAYEVAIPLTGVDAQVAGFITGGLMWTIPMIVLGGLGFAYLLRLTFGRPMQAMIARIRDIAEGEGDLTKRLDAANSDELGTMATWFNKFVGKLESILGEIRKGASEIDAGSSQVSATSQSVAPASWSRPRWERRCCTTPTARPRFARCCHRARRDGAGVRSLWQGAPGIGRVRVVSPRAGRERGVQLRAAGQGGGRRGPLHHLGQRPLRQRALRPRPRGEGHTCVY
jgi:hypothetical protein